MLVNSFIFKAAIETINAKEARLLVLATTTQPLLSEGFTVKKFLILILIERHIVHRKTDSSIVPHGQAFFGKLTLLLHCFCFLVSKLVTVQYIFFLAILIVKVCTVYNVEQMIILISIPTFYYLANGFPVDLFIIVVDSLRENLFVAIHLSVKLF